MHAFISADKPLKLIKAQFVSQATPSEILVGVVSCPDPTLSLA